MDEIEVGWTIKWRSHFGDRTGKVLSIVRSRVDGDVIGYYVSEDRSSQGFPGMGSPILVGTLLTNIEVVSRG